MCSALYSAHYGGGHPVGRHTTPHIRRRPHEQVAVPRRLVAHPCLKGLVPISVWQPTACWNRSMAVLPMIAAVLGLVRLGPPTKAHAMHVCMPTLLTATMVSRFVVYGHNFKVCGVAWPAECRAAWRLGLVCLSSLCETNTIRMQWPECRFGHPDTILQSCNAVRRVHGTSGWLSGLDGQCRMGPALYFAIGTQCQCSRSVAGQGPL